METNKNKYDVIVVGGGPAGSTIASILAREGRSVVLFEKEVFPRHHIGESLMTDTYWTFKRMGLLEKLKNSPFVRKYSVQFANSAGRESRPFYFFEAMHHESAVTWQVTRAEFDKMLIDHAADQGAVVHQGTAVKQVLFDGDRAVGVEVQMADGSRQTFHARVIVDPLQLPDNRTVQRIGAGGRSRCEIAVDASLELPTPHRQHDARKPAACKRNRPPAKNGDAQLTLAEVIPTSLPAAGRAAPGTTQLPDPPLTTDVDLGDV